MLHILNGDATLNLIKESSVKGAFLVWKDMLMEGPVSASGAGGKPKSKGGLDWKARAAYLNRRYGIDAGKYLSGMNAFFKVLDKAAQGKDEVVFWFEEDFFCQIHLVYLLANLPGALKRKGRASVICPEKPLGVRLPAAFPKLLAGRIPVDAPLLSLASKVWNAYAASSSKGWDSFLKWAQSGKGFEPWPLLKSGLRSHLGRLPSANGRPNAMESALLRSASAGHTPFNQFVKRVWNEPLIRPLGLGDLQIARSALDLSLRDRPLIGIEGPDHAPAPGKPFRFPEWKLHLTADGKARLAEAGSGPLPADAKSVPGNDGKAMAKGKSAAKRPQKAAVKKAGKTAAKAPVESKRKAAKK